MTCSNKPKGIISIVALIIFSLLMLFALIINLIVYDTYQIIKNTNNFFTARDVTSSVSEYLKAEIVLTDIINTNVNEEMITSAIFEIAKIFESRITVETSRLPLSGFYRENPFFTSPTYFE